MPDLTAVVLTKNEEAYIADCLRSLQWCDQVLVLDSFSTDRTVEIARQYGAAVVQRPFRNFADQRNAAIEMVRSDWILFVDADERVSPQLATEVSTAISGHKYTGYWIPTHNHHVGKLILYAGLHPDYHLRLFKRAKGRYDAAQKVHEMVILEGAAGYFANPLIHVWHETWSEFVDHQERYAQMKAEMLFERGVKPSYHFVAGPILEFLRRYVVLKGYRDGLHGLRLSYLFAYYFFKMYVILSKLWKIDAGKTMP